MTVEKMIEDMAIAIVGTVGVERKARAAANAIGIPLETLAALRAGTWKAVPAGPTDDMARPLTRLWLLADQEPTAEDMQLARQYAAIMLAAAPAKPESGE